MATAASNTDVAILSRIIAPDEAGLSPEMANLVLSLDFLPDDRARMDELAAMARDDTLAFQEQEELDDYERVGHLLSLLWSKARVSLANTDSS